MEGGRALGAAALTTDGGLGGVLRVLDEPVVKVRVDRPRGRVRVEAVEVRSRIASGCRVDALGREGAHEGDVGGCAEPLGLADARGP